jgi:hypothetical protein
MTNPTSDMVLDRIKQFGQTHQAQNQQAQTNQNVRN